MLVHPMLDLIDQYLAGLPAERDIVSAKEVRDMLLDLRLTFMVRGDEPVITEERLPDVRIYRWTRGGLPPVDGGGEPPYPHGPGEL